MKMINAHLICDLGTLTACPLMGHSRVRNTPATTFHRIFPGECTGLGSEPSVMHSLELLSGLYEQGSIPFVKVNEIVNQICCLCYTSDNQFPKKPCRSPC